MSTATPAALQLAPSLYEAERCRMASSSGHAAASSAMTATTLSATAAVPSRVVRQRTARMTTDTTMPPMAAQFRMGRADSSGGFASTCTLPLS